MPTVTDKEPQSLDQDHLYSSVATKKKQTEIKTAFSVLVILYRVFQKKTYKV